MTCPFCGHLQAMRSGACESCGRGLPPPAADNEVTTISRPPSTASAADDRTTAGPFRATPPGGQPQAAGLLEPGRTINNRYRVIRLLGQGGMGAVYQAWDDALGIPVALKVILPHQDDPAGTAEVERRFKKELLLARQITHRNVVRIHDIGDVDGAKFISMHYVAGQDLASLLAKGPIPVARALALARQIAEGLAAAHDAGVVHRDLKPGNIMVQEDGWALLMDFGIARSVRSGTAPGTIVGTVIGTIDYMAPEQARGEIVDGRADIYAFGLILYEMLAGRRTPMGDSAIGDLMARMNAAPPPVRSLKPEVPEPLDALVTKCMQPAPDARFQSSVELIAALNALDAEGHHVRAVSRVARWKIGVAGLLLIGAAAAGTRAVLGGPDGPPAAREPMSVLIADFENRANDPVFERALENALSVAMEGAPFITAFSPATARAVNERLGRGPRLDEEGAKLVSQREGINVVLAGMVELDDGRYRVTVRAVDPIPGTLVATATATASSKGEVLSAVNTVAGRLREALGDSTTESGRLAASETFTAASLEAAQSYSRAQDLQQAAKYEESITHYRRAIELDPEFGRAYSGLALSTANVGRIEEAQTLFKEALARLDRMSEREKYRTLGVYYSRIARDPEKAMENFALLVDRYPADDVALNNLALAHFNALDFPKALEFGGRLVSLYRNSTLYQYNYALYAMYASDFDLGRAHAEIAISQSADTPKAYLPLAMSALARDDLEQASKTWHTAAASGSGGASLAAMGLADLAMYEGRFGAVEAILAPSTAADRESQRRSGVALRLIALAEALQSLGRQRDAVAAINEAIGLSASEAVTVPAARMLLTAGRRAEAMKIADDLRARLPARPRAYARMIEAEAALHEGRTPEAVEGFKAALGVADLWLVRYALGVAFVRAGAYREAVSEFELCEQRRGEAASVFLDDFPTWRYTVPLQYWQARARDGLGMTAQAVEGYTKYLSLRRDAAADPLAADARRRLAR